MSIENTIAKIAEVNIILRNAFSLQKKSRHNGQDLYMDLEKFNSV